MLVAADDFVSALGDLSLHWHVTNDVIGIAEDEDVFIACAQFTFQPQRVFHGYFSRKSYQRERISKRQGLDLERDAFRQFLQGSQMLCPFPDVFAGRLE